MKFNLTGKRVWVAGHNGMVGRALVRRLESESCEVIVAPYSVDLRRQEDVKRWMSWNKPEVVFVAAAKVGGIFANDMRPAEFIYDNLAIETNIIEIASRVNVKKLLFLGSSCIYPKLAPQPIPEDALLTGPLEPTNQWYSIAKIAGIMMCQAYRRQYGCNFISAMPTNLYGPNDNFHVKSGHVVPSLMAKAHSIKIGLSKESELEVWGSGNPLREFLYVDDLADALVFLMKNYEDEEHINVGFGKDVTIRELAELITKIVGIENKLRFNTSMPDGTPRKLLDSSKLLKMGWTPQTGLEDGLRKTYEWYSKKFQQDVEDGQDTPNRTRR